MVRRVWFESVERGLRVKMWLEECGLGGEECGLRVRSVV